MDFLRRTWAEIDLDCITHNYHEIRKLLAPTCKMMAVVKADAYGHGDGYVARQLQAEGAEWFAVSNINEAYSLRKQGITRPILILGYTPPQRADELAKENITQSVFSADYAKALSDAAHEIGVRLDCHIIVDTGMSRLGFFAQQGSEPAAADAIAAACALPGLSCTGIFTHFSSADDFSWEALSYTHRQHKSFQSVLSLLEERKITFQLKHCCNSAATLLYPEWHMDLVRPGVVLYGMSPSDDCAGLADLQPAMSLYTTVAMTKQVPKGTAVSYERKYTTQTDGQRIASLEVGYDDGYRRNFTNRGRVILRDKLAPVIGAVCMDQIMVEATHIPDAAAGDLVTLVGKSGDVRITFDDYAHINGTINYEETCLIGRRVPRVYLRDGKQVGVVDYVLDILPKT